jgi:hypothetical protein
MSNLVDLGEAGRPAGQGMGRTKFPQNAIKKDIEEKKVISEMSWNNPRISG